MEDMHRQHLINLYMYLIKDGHDEITIDKIRETIVEFERDLIKMGRGEMYGATVNMPWPVVMIGVDAREKMIICD